MRTRMNSLVLLAGGMLAAALLAGAPAAQAQQQAPPANPPSKEKPQGVVVPAQGPMPVAVDFGFAVAKQPEKGSLEEVLAEALKNNPDIRVAEAKLHEAEAELSRARLVVLQKVAALYVARKAAQAKVVQAERDLERAGRLKASDALAEADYRAAEQALVAAKAELEKIEAELPVLLGKPPQGMPPDAVVQRAVQFLQRRQQGPDAMSAMSAAALMALAQARLQPAAGQSVPATVAEKVRKALDKPIAVDFKDTPLADILEYLQDKTGIVIRNRVRGRYKITLKFPEPLPLRAVLQALEDEVVGDTSGDIRFVVRDYGLVAVPAGHVLPGALLLDRLTPDFFAGKNPPAEPVEGLVTKVDAKSGLLTLSIGSDAGLEKGHTLEVYRLKPAAKYLGTVRILSVMPHEAVAQPGSRMADPVQIGDRVAGKVLDR